MNYNRSIKRQIELNANSEKVWSIISKKSNLELFHPFCLKNPTIEWSDNSHKDTIYYLNGWILERNWVNWIPGKGYDLLIGEKKKKKSYVSWRIIAGKNQQSSILSIEIQPWFINQGNKWMQTIPFLLFAKPKLSSYLDSVLKGIDWYINNEMPVPKNHFGVHSWFSKKI